MIKKIANLTLICLFILLTLQYLANFYIVCFLFILYLLYLAQIAKLPLSIFFNLSYGGIINRFVSVFFVWTVLTLIGGIMIHFTVLTNLVYWFILMITGLIICWLYYWAGQQTDTKKVKVELEVINFHLPSAKISVIIYLVFFFWGFSVLNNSQSTDLIVNPWTVIPANYLVIFLIATFVLGSLIFSRISKGTILFLLIMHSFLLHSYLPLTHKYVYGADQWRHLAVERQLLAEKSMSIPFFDKAPKNILHALNPGRFAYSQFWFSEVFIAKLSGMDLLRINKWWVALFFSVMLPILIYRLSRALKLSQKASLLAIWLSFLLFPIQSLGAISLPVSYGLIIWLLMLLLLLQSKLQNKPAMIILGLLTMISLFGYTLYFILFILVCAIYFVSKNDFVLDNKKYLYPVLIFGTGLAIPAIELISQYSHFGVINISKLIKQFVGNFSSYFLATGPRPHDIVNGNILFNQTPSYAFGNNFFTSGNLIYLMVIAVIVWLVIFYGWFLLIRREKNIIALLSASLFITYFVGLYILSGQKLLSRRLDMTISVLIAILLAVAIDKFILQKNIHNVFRKYLFLSFFTIAITISYGLGPDTIAVSDDQFQAAKYLTKKIGTDDKQCIISDTYSLLLLEYHSSKRIVGGGLPMGKNFEQQALVKMLEDLKKGNDIANVFSRGLSLSKADNCYVMLTKDELDSSKKELDLFSSLEKKQGDVIIYVNKSN